MLKKILLMLSIVIACSACSNEKMEQSMILSKDSSNQNNQNDKSNGDIVCKTENGLEYVIEPKATYDPNNKIPIWEVYGSTKNEMDYLKEILDTEPKGAETFYDGAGELPQPIKKENMHSIGDKVFLSVENCYLTVNDCKIYDNINEFNKDDFFDKDYYSDFIVDKDGNVKEVDAMKAMCLKKGSDEVVYEKCKTPMKFVVFDCLLEGNSDWVQLFSISAFKLIPIVENGDFYEHYFEVKAKENNAYYMSYSYDNFISRDFVYFDKAIFREMSVRSSFLHTYITKGEKINFKLGAYVEEELIDNMCLFYMTPSYCNIFTDSILQKGIKMFD